MECKYCGKKLIEGAKYCVYCAKPVEEEIKKEEEQQKKETNILLLVILGVVLLIMLGVGFFVYNNYIVKNNKAVKKEKENITEKVEEDKIPTLSKDQVKKLVDDYYFIGASPNENLFTVTFNEDVKKTITLRNIHNDIKSITCDQIEGFSMIGETCSNGKDKITQGRTISYDILNNKYKFLFGKSNELSKENIKDLNYITTWEYQADKNLFLETMIISGLEGNSYYTIYGIKDFKQSNEKLVVNVGYIFMDSKELNGENLISGIISGEEVTYKEEEINKNTFNQEFLEKYLDKLDTYEITFNYEDDHYIFESIKKL